MATIYNWEKALREGKSKKNPNNPSFSSTLLDEIYRSIDGGEEKNREFKLPREKNVKIRQCVYSGGGGGGGSRGKGSSTVEDEEIATLRRACLVEKWMEKKVNEKVYGGGGRRGSALPEIDRRSVLDNDPLFFSSSSSSSNSSFGFNEPDGFDGTKSKPSCFTPFKPKQIKTSVSAKSSAKQNEFYLFDDCRNHQTNKTENSLIRSKARAAKIYTSLKKMKQPISPGGRLTSFLNSIFTNGTAKKGKDLNSSVDYEDAKMERKSKSIQGSTCSSASSFSRSCLSKNSPRSNEKLSNGIKRSVRFYPVSVIVDEDCRPCGQKSINDEHSDHKQRNVEIRIPIHRSPEKNQKEFSSVPNQKKENKFTATNIDKEDCFDDEECDDDDLASDTSSDLFELDHLTIFGEERFCEELPVYETTHLNKNRAIASGLIR